MDGDCDACVLCGLVRHGVTTIFLLNVSLKCFNITTQLGSATRSHQAAGTKRSQLRAGSLKRQRSSPISKKIEARRDDNDDNRQRGDR